MAVAIMWVLGTEPGFFVCCWVLSDPDTAQFGYRWFSGPGMWSAFVPSLSPGATLWMFFQQNNNFYNLISWLYYLTAKDVTSKLWPCALLQLSMVVSWQLQNILDENHHSFRDFGGKNKGRGVERSYAVKSMHCSYRGPHFLLSTQPRWLTAACHSSSRGSDTPF